MGDSSFLADRQKHSSDRLAELSSRLAEITSDLELDGLSIICAGSYARGEASEHSDIDLFFAYVNKPSSTRPNTNHLRLFGRLIDLNEQMGFPPYSRDAHFLKTLNAAAMRPHLGSPQDDESNYFTMRMLTLLESACVLGEESYESIVGGFIEAYCADVGRHPDEFWPLALVNDIRRYWLTLLLNYENANYRERTQDPEMDEDPEVERRVRRFKLSFSRKMTCFASLAAIASQQAPHTEATLRGLVGLSPRDRLLRVAEDMPATRVIVDRIMSLYIWFLEQTGKSKEELRAVFSREEAHTGYTEKVEEFGKSIFDLLCEIDHQRGADRPPLLRHLVV